MAEDTRQLRLLPAAQPLVERFGVAFFQSVPRSPGVYRLYDAGNRLVYVGKARNLRLRLASYRRTRGQSRKTIRLIHEVRRIEWEVRSSEAEARLLENELIRTHRPRFNRVGTWPRSARFVQLEEAGGGLRLALSAEPAGESYGAFRAGAALALGALARLLWLAWNRTGDLRALPLGWVGLEGMRSLAADHPEAGGWVSDVRAFLAGEGDGLLARLVTAVPEPGTPFARAYVARQFEVLSDFYRRGPMVTRRLCGILEPGVRALAPEQVDDLLVVSPTPVPAAPFRPTP